MPAKFTKIVKRVLLVFITAVSIIVFVLYVVLFSPFTVPPAIGRNLPSNFAEADSVFKERVRKEFPVPITNDELVKELEQQGFKVTRNIKDQPKLGWASFVRSQFPCDLEWRIVWDKEDNGYAANIRGVYGATCL